MLLRHGTLHPFRVDCRSPCLAITARHEAAHFVGFPLDCNEKLLGQRAFGLLGQIGESCRIVYCQVGQDLAVEFYPRQL